MRNLVAADQRQRDGLPGIIRESSHSFAIKTFRTLRRLFFAAFWSAVNRGLGPRKLMYFLTAKSTKNSPTDAFADFVPSNVRPPKRRVLGDCANIHKTSALSLGAEQEQPTACVPGAGGWQRRPQAKADTCCLPSRHSLYGACFCAVKARFTAPAQRESEGTPARTACGWFWAPFTTKRYITASVKHSEKRIGIFVT